MIASELAKERARRAPFTSIVYYHHAKALCASHVFSISLWILISFTVGDTTCQTGFPKKYYFNYLKSNYLKLYESRELVNFF